MSLVFWISAYIILTWNLQFTEAACTFPSHLRGTWHGSDFGQAAFSSSQFTLSNKLMKVDSYTSIMSQFNALTFNCEQQIGNIIYIRSDEFVQFFSTFRITMCWQIVSSASSKIVYNSAMSVLLNTTNARFLLKSASATFSMYTECILNGPYDASAARIMVKDGYISSAKIDCPADFLGTFSYEFDQGSGNQCYSDTHLYTCSDKTLLSYNYTLCSAVQAYSVEGQLNCVYYVTSGNETYVTVYNLDSATTDELTYFRFSCYVVSYASNRTATATQYPQACMQNQNATAYVSPGALLTLKRISSCPVSEIDQVLSAATVVSIIVVLFLLIAVFTVVFFCWKKKKQDKKIRPNDRNPLEVKAPPVDHFDRVGSSMSRCGAISPYSPYPTLSEIAVFRFGPSPIPDYDGGTSLGGTMAPGLPEDDIAQAIKKRFEYEMDFESDTMTSDPSRPVTRGDPDNISLPMYSENGISTPEPTRIREVFEKLETTARQDEELSNTIPYGSGNGIDVNEEKTTSNEQKHNGSIATVIDQTDDPELNENSHGQNDGQIDRDDKNFLYQSTKIEDDTIPIVDTDS